MDWSKAYFQKIMTQFMAHLKDTFDNILYFSYYQQIP